MNKFLVSAAALVAAGLATPVIAADSVSATANASAQPANNSQARASNPQRRICVRMDMTGSRMTRNVCRTQAEWDRAGGVPDQDR